MTQFNLYIHGVPVGHEIYPRDEAEDYIRIFYNHDTEVKESSFMQIDIINGKSFYTYLHKKNVSNSLGRPGSYFGITICFPKVYCTNVQMLYDILDTIYQKICIGCLIKQEQGSEQFLVKEIERTQYKGSPVFNYINAAFKQNIETCLSNNFEELKGFTNQIGEVKFSLKEVDSPLFRETLKNRRVLVSPEYGTISVAYNNLIKEVEPLKVEHLQFKQDNTILKDKNKNLTDEVTRLEKELANAESNIEKKYKDKLKEAQSRCDEVEKENKELEKKIKEVANTVDLIDEPFKKLARLLAGRFQEESKGRNHKTIETHSHERKEYPIKAWLSWVNLILLLCILALLGYGVYTFSELHKPFTVEAIPEQETTRYEDNDTKTTSDADSTSNGNSNTKSAQGSETSQLTYDDLSSCKINITGYSGNGNLKKGKKYTLSIVKETGEEANVPDGIWHATTNPENLSSIESLPGIKIEGNTFTVEESVKEETNVLISYTVDNQQKIHRTIKVE